MENGPENWPAGSYARAKAMWINDAPPMDILAACGITENALYRARLKFGWPDRSRAGTLTPQKLEAIRADWEARDSLTKICERHGHGHEFIKKLAEDHGWSERFNPRPPLPPGDPFMWGLINKGTILEGATFIR